MEKVLYPLELILAGRETENEIKSHAVCQAVIRVVEKTAA